MHDEVHDVELLTLVSDVLVQARIEHLLLDHYVSVVCRRNFVVQSLVRLRAHARRLGDRNGPRGHRRLL